MREGKWCCHTAFATCLAIIGEISETIPVSDLDDWQLPEIYYRDTRKVAYPIDDLFAEIDQSIEENGHAA